jgi:hypothetical protein
MLQILLVFDTAFMMLSLQRMLRIRSSSSSSSLDQMNECKTMTGEVYTFGTELRPGIVLQAILSVRGATKYEK